MRIAWERKRGKGWREGAEMDFAGSLWRTIHATHTRAHRATILSILLFLQHASHGRVHQLLSPGQEMCGRHGDGSATRLTTLLITTCQHRRVPCARGCVFFSRLMRLRRHGRHVCATGKGTVYEIVYLESVETAGGGCTAGAVATTEKYKTACGLR